MTYSLHSNLRGYFCIPERTATFGFRNVDSDALTLSFSTSPPTRNRPDAECVRGLFHVLHRLYIAGKGASLATAVYDHVLAITRGSPKFILNAINLGEGLARSDPSPSQDDSEPVRPGVRLPVCACRDSGLPPWICFHACVDEWTGEWW